ncbi:potassium-transporting ATPase subunit KdpC [Streptomyces sp. NPDC054956]
MNNSLGNTARLIGAGLRALLVLTVLCGVLYPLAITGIAQTAFGHEANGSEIKDAGGRVVGSSLIGQSYGDDPRWFQGRPAAGLAENTLNTRYKLLVSGATNKAADSPELLKAVEEAKAKVVLDNTVPGYTPRISEIPADSVTSSGSGLDPNISPEYAKLQTARVAEKNHLPAAEVAKLVETHTEGRTLGFMGEPRVNVLELNVALKALTEK